MTLLVPKHIADESRVSTEELNFLIENPPLIPTGPHILIRVENAQELSAGGVVLGTEQGLRREQLGSECGYVIAMGPTAYDGLHCEVEDGVSLPWCEPGDKVFFERYAGKVPEIEGLKPGTIRILEDEEVIAKWPKQ